MRRLSRSRWHWLGVATLSASGLTSACVDLLDIPHYRPAPAAPDGNAGRSSTGGTVGAGTTSTGGAGATSMGGTGEPSAGRAGDTGAAARPCGLMDPYWTFLDDMPNGFRLGPAPPGSSVVVNPSIDQMVFDLKFDRSVSDNQDAYVQNAFASMNLAGKTVTACLRLFDPAEHPPPHPVIELFVITGDDTNAYSEVLTLPADGSWTPIVLPMDSPARTDGGTVAAPGDSHGLGFKIVTLGAGYGPVEIAVDAIAIA